MGYNGGFTTSELGGLGEESVLDGPGKKPWGVSTISAVGRLLGGQKGLRERRGS